MDSDDVLILIVQFLQSLNIAAYLYNHINFNAKFLSVPNFSETEECQSSLMALLFETVGNNELGRHFGKCYCVNKLPLSKLSGTFRKLVDLKLKL